MEKTFVMIKPDGVQRNLIGEIISRFEGKGLKLVALKFIHIDEETAHMHYGEHKDRPFFSGLIRHITSGPVVTMILEGKDAVSLVRKMVGATSPLEAEAGSIRGDYALEVGRNIIHASDSLESAEREIALFFNKDEMTKYDKDNDKWLYE